jgi:hypothetical protein
VRRRYLLLGSLAVLSSALAVAQDAPESLLPPGFERPKSRPAPASAPKPDNEDDGVSVPVIQPIPGASGGSAAAPAVPTRKAPSLGELEKMSPEELDKLLGLRPRSDMPAAARRSMKQVGVLAASEGGFQPGSFNAQDPALVKAVLAGNRGQLVSRWGHILLRRALASRLTAPSRMNPADFVAARAALLVRMGEGEAARALVQDVDAGNFTPDLTQAALNAYVASADLTGICPAVAVQGGARKDPEWQVARAICGAFSGEGTYSLNQLEKMQRAEAWPKIDLLLARKYAGAGGKGRQAVTIEWDGVEDMNPWRYALTIATGLEPPAALMNGVSWRYDATAATAPMLGLPTRAAAADRAAAAGVLSSAAMVDLYSQIFAQRDITGIWQDRAGRLRAAYVAEGEDARLAAIKGLWNDAPGPQHRYGRQVLTAYAAARLPVSPAMSDDAPDLLASMLAAGLDANALRWAQVTDTGSQAWGLLTLAAPNRSTPVDGGALSSYYSGDNSEGYRKSAFLLAGLAGLGRIEDSVARDFAGKLGIDLYADSNWTKAIVSAADSNNAAMVAVLAGLGMQGDSWAKMTPRYLYHIVAALSRVGLEAEARMIAAEAVARG